MRAVQYIILAAAPHGRPMTAGKAASQAAHAAVEGVRLTDKESNLYDDWYKGGHHTKIVLQTDDVVAAKMYLEERGIKCALIIDEGRTEFDADLTPTAVGCALVNKDNPHIERTFESFRLYKQAAPSIVVIENMTLTGPQRRDIREYAEAGQIEAAMEYIEKLRELHREHERPGRYGWKPWRREFWGMRPK